MAEIFGKTVSNVAEQDDTIAGRPPISELGGEKHPQREVLIVGELSDEVVAQIKAAEYGATAAC